MNFSLPSSPLLKYGLLLVAALLLIWVFLPNPRPTTTPAPASTPASTKLTARQAADAEAQGWAYTDSVLANHSQLEQVSAGRQQAQARYNKVVTNHRIENETLRHLPAAARRTADAEYLRNYAGPKPCPRCDSLLRP